MTVGCGMREMHLGTNNSKCAGQPVGWVSNEKTYVLSEMPSIRTHIPALAWPNAT